MIPRYQRILFWTLVAGISLMALFLIRGCHQAHRRLTASLNDSSPIAAPAEATPEDVTLYLANDAKGSITPTTSQVALPKEPALRGQILLNHLLKQYTQPDSPHPLQSGPAVDDVFLMSSKPGEDSGETAIINFHGSFADNHPSGIEVETFSISSIIGTLHAASPEITQVRFLVDGQPRETLAGHADLTRAYPAIDTSTKSSNSPQSTAP
jgi:Sporulation and spore germination